MMSYSHNDIIWLCYGDNLIQHVLQLDAFLYSIHTHHRHHHHHHHHHHHYHHPHPHHHHHHYHHHHHHQCHHHCQHYYYSVIITFITIYMEHCNTLSIMYSCFTSSSLSSSSSSLSSSSSSVSSSSLSSSSSSSSSLSSSSSSSVSSSLSTLLLFCYYYQFCILFTFTFSGRIFNQSDDTDLPVFQHMCSGSGYIVPHSLCYLHVCYQKCVVYMAKHYEYYYPENILGKLLLYLTYKNTKSILLRE